MSVVSLNDFGAVFLSPTLSFFNDSLAKNTQEDSKLFFLAREGYWLERSYTAYTKAKGRKSNSAYMLVSRAFLFKIGLMQPKTWSYSLNFAFEDTLYNLMKNRFMLSDANIFQIFTEIELEEKLTLPKDIAKIEAIFLTKQPQFNSLLHATYEAYKSYLHSIDFFSAEKVNLVDIGYSGTIQALLSTIFEKDTVGHYLIASKPGVRKENGQTIECKGYLKEGLKMNEGYVPLDRSMILESLLTAPVGQFQNISVNVLDKQKFDFYYGRKVASQHQFYIIEAIMKGAINRMVLNAQTLTEFEPQEVESMLSAFMTKKGMIPSSSWPIFEIDDDTANEGTLNTLNFWGIKA